MAGRRVQHLVERGRGYQVRLPVPVDVQPVLGRKELRWSVQTRVPSVAKERVLKATLAFRRLCDKLRHMKDITVEDAREIAQTFYQSLVESYRSPPAVDDEAVDHDAGYQAVLADEFISDLEDQIRSRSFSSAIVNTAGQKASDDGFVLPPPDSDSFRALCEGIARAQMEHARFTLFRQRDMLSVYSPEDELFRLQAVRQTVSPDGLQSIAIQKGLTLAEALKIHTEAHSIGPVNWAPKTAEEKKRTLEIVKVVLGGDTPVKSFTTEHVRTVRDFMQGLRARVELDSANPINMQAKRESDRLNPKTSSKYFGYFRSFLKLLVTEGYLEAEPGETIKLAIPKGSVRGIVRSFNFEELDTIFSSPLYAGFHSKKRRHQPGTMKRQDGLYWMFLLGLHTGMRAGELLQISKSDIRVNDQISHIDIRSDLDLKTASSVRKVPLHPDLFEYGLVGWLSERPKIAEQRLFCEIALGPQGHRTGTAFKQLNAYLKRIGVKTGRDLVFHSFRHSFMDATRNSKVPYERAKQIVGHVDSSVSGGYGQGASLPVLAKEMAEIDFGISDEVRTLLKANAKA